MNKEDKEELKENIGTINKIANKKLGSSVKKKMENNIKGAMIGGAVGVVVGIATRKNLILSGLIGIIIGRLILIKK
tara:strand:- start:1684 stop:1911 length:228 start_codon:yes stop_codon:yes gene_type:complete